MAPYLAVSFVCDVCKILCQCVKKIFRTLPPALAMVSGDVGFLLCIYNEHLLVSVPIYFDKYKLNVSNLQRASVGIFGQCGFAP